MKDKVLTISIAAYQVEPYIRQTLDSLMDEEIIDELEIFVVDDGGSDGTLEIARSYAARYPGSVFPVHKENGGYGTTVNYSIEHATGKYFKCLDGDDWFDMQGLKKLVAELKRIDTDVVVIPYYHGADENALSLRSMPRMDGEQVIAEMDVRSLPTIGMWALCYKTSILRDSGLRMPAHTFYTDQYFATVPFAAARTIRFYDFPVYCYRVGRDGQSVSRDSRVRHAQQMLDICLDLCRFAAGQQEEGNPNAAYIVHRAAGYHITAVRTILLRPVNRQTLDQLKAYEKACRDACPDAYERSVYLNNTSSKVLRVLRMSHFAAYWLLKLLPGGAPNF